MLRLICRVIHIAATCTSLGELFYARVVLLPTVRELPELEAARVLQHAVKRFAPIKWIGVTLIAITGVIQWWYTYPEVADTSRYLLYFALKMTGAAGLFGITFLLALPNPRLDGMRQRRAVWSGINIACGLAILIGAALMRTVPRLR